MKRVVSLILTLVIVMTAFSCLSTVISAQSVKIEYDSKVFNYVPSDTVYVNDKEYKKYVVVDTYEGLTSLDVIYVDSDDNLVTDAQLLDKLVYTSIIKSRILSGTDNKAVIDAIEHTFSIERR